MSNKTAWRQEETHSGQRACVLAAKDRRDAPGHCALKHPRVGRGRILRRVHGLCLCLRLRLDLGCVRRLQHVSRHSLGQCHPLQRGHRLLDRRRPVPRRVAVVRILVIVFLEL